MIQVALVFLGTMAIFRTRGYLAPAFGILAVVLCISIEIAITVFTANDQQEIGIASSFATSIFAVVVTFMAMAAISYALPYQDHRTKAKKTQFPYLVVGIFLAIASFPIALIAGINGGATAATTPFILCALGAAYCFRIHTQQKAKSADDIIKSTASKVKQRRPFVLFLRSFMLRKAYIAGPLSCAAFIPFHPAFFRRIIGITFDEFISDPAKRLLGPVIALGDPNDYLPSHGAAKVYQGDDSWQDKVMEYINYSSVILLLEGDTRGLSWELEYIRQNVPPQRVFILTYAKKFRIKGLFWGTNPRKDLWPGFSRILEQAGIPALKDPGPGVVLAFSDDWRPYILSESAKRGMQYVQAISKQLGSDLSPIEAQPLD